MIEIRQNPISGRARSAGTHFGGWRRSRSAVSGTAVVVCDARSGPHATCGARFTAAATQSADQARAAAATEGWTYEQARRADYCPGHSPGFSRQPEGGQ